MERKPNIEHMNHPYHRRRFDFRAFEQFIDDALVDVQEVTTGDSTSADNVPSLEVHLADGDGAIGIDSLNVDNMS